MGTLFLVSVSVLLISWLVSIGGLYFAIKAKEKNNIKTSKTLYAIMVLGEMFNEISWYALIISIIGLIVNTVR